QRLIEESYYRRSRDTKADMERTDSRNRIRTALLRKGMTEEDADAAIDLGIADDQLRPPAPKPVQMLPGGFEPTDEGRAASIKYQQSIHPSAPRNIDPLSPQGIAAQQALAAGKTKPGKMLPTSALQQLAMFSDLEKAARSIPVAMEAAGGDIGVGPVIGRMPDFVRNKVSGGNKIDARALVSSIAGQYMSLISGAAVSPSEAARLQPFVPNEKDDEPTIRRKALFFANRLATIRKEREATFKRGGYSLADDGSGEEPPENAMEDALQQFLRAGKPPGE
ncbi:MAG: hypothetical protein AAB368_08290, partial [bacterium]